MLNITVQDAKQLQITGTTQEEYFNSAVYKTEQAIVYTAKRGGSDVEIDVSGLSDETFGKLLEQVKEAGFSISGDQRNSTYFHVFTVSWSN